ncbi:pyridoxal phosphate-dependent aminotransferase [Candidatus Karelsulcia muelleri]
MNSFLLSNRIKTVKSSQTLIMAEKAKTLNKLGYNVINLSIGEPDFSPPKFVLRAAQKAIDDGYHSYTPVAGEKYLRELICKKFKYKNDIHYYPSQIIVSNGVKQAIMNVFLALLNTKDEVIIPAPYWGSYYEMVKFCNAKPIILDSNLENNFKLNIALLKQKISNKTKIIILNSPCNPTGTVYSLEELEEIVNILKQHKKIIILSDEIYEDIIYNKEHISIGSFPEVYDQTVTLSGFSKSFALTGWRIGYMGAPEWLSKACVKIQGQTTSGVNSIAQQAAISVLENSTKTFLKQIVNKFREKRNLLIKLLNEIPGIKFCAPDGAFYFFIDFTYSRFFKKKFNNSDEFVNFLLNKVYISSVSGSAFGNPNCFRISFATSKKNLLEAFRIIKKIY